MAKTETFKSDVDDSPIEPPNVVTITIERQDEAREIHMTEDQFADLMDEAESLSAIYFNE